MTRRLAVQPSDTHNFIWHLKLSVLNTCQQEVFPTKTVNVAEISCSWIPLDALLKMFSSTPKSECTALCSVGSLTRDCGLSYFRHFRNISIAVGYFFIDKNS